MDDDQTTAGGLNNQPDTATSYEDVAYGGAGRDVLIGNTGGDRLIDWVGVFNSYLVPFSPFGAATISRALAPGIIDICCNCRKPTAPTAPVPTKPAPTSGATASRMASSAWLIQRGLRLAGTDRRTR